jgi:hypothetical protein
MEERTETLNKRLRCKGIAWLGRQDSNLGMAESKSAALPLGYAPTGGDIAAPPVARNRGVWGALARTCGPRIASL